MKAIRNMAILLVLLCTGCAAVVVGGAAAVGTYTYVAGQLKKTYNVNLDGAYRASIAGCESLGLPVLEREMQLSQATVKTRDGEREVWINLKTQSSTTTEISIRVGYLGDEQASRRIHDAIGAKL
ncbi:DUF3568 family protein [Desulfomicrobium escambiense]|uniref:DUF3568 family protein n=1 Tax=Desulfomicrobium escambiense TaxID=29503 RepID=UPI00041EAEFE|nr:DUF3568 family protein [Desulfomicrobium escambiense]